MNHQHLVFCRPVGQWLALQPVEQFQPVRGLQDGIDFRVGRMTIRKPVMLGQQVQIMVAQRHDEIVTQAFQQTEDFQGVAAAINKVAGALQAVSGGVEVNLLQQPLQRAVTTLDVADQVSGHLQALVQRFRRGQHKLRNRGPDSLAAVGDEFITSRHGTVGSRDQGATGIGE